jgi:hypothetical protein
MALLTGALKFGALLMAAPSAGAANTPDVPARLSTIAATAASNVIFMDLPRRLERVKGFGPSYSARRGSKLDILTVSEIPPPQ